MLGFNDKFHVTLKISEMEFAEKLLISIDTEFDKLKNKSPSRLLQYVGKIEHNSFELQSAQKRLIRLPGKLKGTFEIEDSQLIVDGHVVNYKFLLIWLICYTMFGLLMAINFIFFNPSDDGADIGFVIFSIIGIINYALSIKKLNKLKDDFLDKIESL